MSADETRALFVQSEAGLIPGDWAVKRIGEFLQFYSGKAHESFVSPSGKYVVVNSKFISTDGKVRKHCTVNRLPARVGDVLMVMSDLPNGRALAKCFLVDRDGCYAVNQRVCIFRTRTQDPRYLRYALNRNPYFMTFDDGVQQTHLLNDPIRSCPVVLPSPFEQTAIADALTDIDSLTASLERLITKKKAIKQGMMQQLLTGKDRLPGFNKDWPRFRFDQLAEPVGDRTDPRGMPTSTRLVELEHIEPNGGRLLGSTMAHDAVSLKTVFQTGDVLFGKLRAYLRKYWLAEWSGICSTEIWALRATPETDSSYVRYLIETDRFIEVASGGYGTHMPRSDWSSLRGLTFDVPSHDEQEAIAAALRDVDAEIASLRHRLTKAKAVRQGMMQELLTGRTRLPVKEGAA